MQATHLFLKGDDLGWGVPGLGDDLGWVGEATRDAQRCGGGPPHLGLLERDIIRARVVYWHYVPQHVCPNTYTNVTIQTLFLFETGREIAQIVSTLEPND